MPQLSEKTKRIDELLKNSNVSLSRHALFESERMANKALVMAREAHDFARMAESLSLLAEIRHNRVELALAANVITIVNTQITDTMQIEPGCYLVEPPQVGADARRLRLAAIKKEVPVAVVCREPLTKTGLCPIVAIGNGGTVRTKVKPPRKSDAPDMQWFIDAMETLGDWAIDMVDPEATLSRRIDLLFDRLDVIPDHRRLHEVLQAACMEAVEQEASSSTTAKSGKRGGSKSRGKSRINS